MRPGAPAHLIVSLSELNKGERRRSPHFQAALHPVFPFHLAMYSRHARRNAAHVLVQTTGPNGPSATSLEYNRPHRGQPVPVFPRRADASKCLPMVKKFPWPALPPDRSSSLFNQIHAREPARRKGTTFPLAGNAPASQAAIFLGIEA
ncbi:hypothetical protein FQ775_24180 [Nitratireductor mangrovi]|uniref:Uncharacterized protein n=1 Tax=Nitratireductor mangrovi TaxID=2599600 RepID=A0A6H0DYI0_9HYPH|nr:hypothetical protein FQ775_24180 [Nitratireductor mangrovi]